jgi:hypothetical protein
MEPLLGSGVLVMVAVDAVVGVRLLLLAARTRQSPEACFGVSFLFMGVLGYPLAIVARKAALAGTPLPWLLSTGLGFQNVAALAMFVATWRTFRPQAGWPLAVVWLAAAVFVASLTGDSLVAGRWQLHDGGVWYQLGFWTRAAAYAWAAAEAIRYYGVMRRRLALGLADPLVTDRFRLWAISSTAITAGFLVFFAGRTGAANAATSAPVLLATSTVGLVAGVTMWLAFLPPAGYVRRVAARPRPIA